MPASRTRSKVATIHRWLAVVLSPVIALIILSGAVLAFRPILRPATPPAPRHVDVARLIALVSRVEATTPVFFVGLPNEHTAVLAEPNGPVAYDLATGATTAMPPEQKPDVFDLAERVHNDLWFGAGWLVGLASFAMIFLVIAGPILARPGRGGGPLGRHIRHGWLLWPFVALLPLSLVMMKLRSPFGLTTHAPVQHSFTQTLGDVSRVADLSRLGGMQSIPDGRAFFILEEDAGPQRYFYVDGRVRRMDSRVSAIGRAIHEGTWAGRWSGMLNVLAAACMLWVLGTGLTSFFTRRRRRRKLTSSSNSPGLDEARAPAA